MIGILIPTRFEASVLINGLSKCQRFPISGMRAWQGKIGGQSVIIGLCGMGPQHSASRGEAFLRTVKPERVILAGFAGGLDPSLKLGDAVCAKGEAIATVMCTSDEVVPTAAAKQHLWRETGCRVVEMEASAVAQVAAAAGVPLTVIRVVSDDCDEALPGCLQYGYDMTLGKESPLRMAAYLATHPREISTLKLFLRRTRPCAAIVAREVQAVIRD